MEISRGRNFREAKKEIYRRAEGQKDRGVEGH